MTTALDIFKADNLPEWWVNVTQSFGNNGEKGTDYGLGGFGKPVGSITSGKVVYVGNGGYPGSSIGQIVQIQAPDGKLLHYQHLMSTNLTVGQVVGVGDVVGLGGGCPVGAYPSGLAGNGCTRYDNFSTGQHIEVRESDTYNPAAGVWGQNWNPNNNQVYLNIVGSTGAQSGTGTIVNASGSNCGTMNWYDWFNPVRSGQYMLCVGGNVASGAQTNVMTIFIRYGEIAGLFILAIIFIIIGFVLLVK